MAALITDDLMGLSRASVTWQRAKPWGRGTWMVTMAVPHVFNGFRWNVLSGPAVTDDFGNLVMVGVLS